MKKVAILIFITAFGLLQACKDTFTDTGPISASSPDALPFYLLTLGNFQQPTAIPSAKSNLTLDKIPVSTEDVKDALFQLIQHHLNTYDRK
ncbi:hypothetical protein [Chitinophaga nivalis]|uniref:RagB/SusD family nutrient uptake outer membrane protein n=1 Tax=Chitinophaga nivalis TaxID=2991709 RepID=A0ABT3II36_9BACT|nr:hypothetical protein [Chitinophaga nivalis]MCW3466849.1 hypothetical protein [Chitinophaga nivalis]MCW3483460.1 hypothetical protein [Chitinophaga nivalis]